MVATPRLVGLIAFGSPIWLLSLASPTVGVVAGAVYLLALLTVCLLDYRSTPDASAIEIERDFGRFSLGTAADVRVRLTNRSKQPLKLIARDELPPGLQQDDPIPEMHLASQAECEFVYHIRPLRRGRYHVENLAFRIRRPGGLVERQVRVSSPAEVRVYPRFSTADEYHLLARISQRDDDVRRPRRVHGRGTDFESLSNYYPGEDPRLVDWKISAKRGHLITRNLQTERGQQISIMIDGGRLMALKIGDFSRFEHALNATVMLSYVAQKRGDSVAVATFSDRVESFVPPLRGTSIMPRVLDSLSTVEVKQVESDYWQVVGQVMDKLKRRSLLIMMADVLDPAGSAGLLLNLTRAASRHLVLCVVLTEPAIAGIADSTPGTIHETYLKAAASHLKLQRQLALDKMRSRGILILEASPEKLNVQLIRRYLEIRKANLQ
jgi:uncharacterized protein (DUF58 family)